MAAPGAEHVQEICSMVAEGLTIREIAQHFGVSGGTIIAWVSGSPEASEQYARARDAASDLFESDIIEAAKNITDPAEARVKIDALKWIAARRAPKKYSERLQQDHISSDGSMTPKPGVDLSKLSDAALKELMNARSAED